MKRIDAFEFLRVAVYHCISLEEMSLIRAYGFSLKEFGATADEAITGRFAVAYDDTECDELLDLPHTDYPLTADVTDEIGCKYIHVWCFE